MWVWNPAKDRANLRKHGLLLEDGIQVLDGDLDAVSVPDPHPDGDRWRTVGRAGDIAVLFVVHTRLPPDGTGRIISVRKASRLERRTYDEAI